MNTTDVIGIALNLVAISIVVYRYYIGAKSSGRNKFLWIVAGIAIYIVTLVLVSAPIYFFVRELPEVIRLVVPLITFVLAITIPLLLSKLWFSPKTAQNLEKDGGFKINWLAFIAAVSVISSVINFIFPSILRNIFSPIGGMNAVANANGALVIVTIISCALFAGFYIYNRTQRKGPKNSGG